MALTEQEELELLELEQEQATAGSAPVRASQADVRKSEPQPSPMEAQREKEARFEAARQEYLKKHGTLPRGKPQAQSIEEESGIQDPTKTREAAVVEHLDQTGELDYESTPGYTPVKVIAAIAGGATSGPLGATAAESLVRYTALVQNLRSALDAGVIDEKRAVELAVAELYKGGATDAAFNFGLPILGQALMKVPGMKWLGDKVAAKLGVKTQADKEAAQRARDLEKRKALAETPEQKQAIDALGSRMEGTIPSSGQITGDVSLAEGAARKGSPQVFAKQSEDLTKAAEGLRRDTLYPSTQQDAVAMGENVTGAIREVEKAVKDRLRPAFAAADNLGVKVDFDPVLQRAKAALEKNGRVPGDKLDPREVAHLQKLVADLEGTAQSGLATNSQVSAEAALDFVTRQKEKLRETLDYKPSKFFETIVGDLAKEADAAYVRAAGAAGQEGTLRGLLAARKDYREMMGTLYEGSMQNALRKAERPEDIGRMLWQPGNVSELKELQKMLDLAVKEGAKGRGEATKLTRDITRGFLQEAVQDIQHAARWSERLGADPKLARTWMTLTSLPGGSQLRGAMQVLEDAAKIAGRDSGELLKGHVIPIVVQRSASGGMGISNVSVKPGWILGGISLTGLTKAMATAYTQGNKGVVNTIMRALRANSAGTAAGAKALQEALPEIEKFAAENDITDIFVGQQEQP